MFFVRRIRRRPAQEIGVCVLCSKPVRDNERALEFLGFWMHADCYDETTRPGTPLVISGRVV